MEDGKDRVVASVQWPAASSEPPTLWPDKWDYVINLMT